MDRRNFLVSTMAGTGSLVAPRRHLARIAEGEETANSPTEPEQTIFPYRAWSFCIAAYNWELLEAYVDGALRRAHDYGINTFELHDYSIGNRGLVDASVNYRDFPKLSARSSLNHRGEVCGRELREHDYAQFRDLAKKIKDKGLSLNCWYHVLRDAPQELFTEYPEIKNLDSGFFWTYLSRLLTEFFDRVPEIDGLTITSLDETPSILATSGSMTRVDRLAKLYITIYEACRRAGKRLIIRDFIATYEDYETFWGVLGKLPQDIYIMTKEVLGDWIHTWMPLNPFMWRYHSRKLIVEFDLYGEYWGALDVPACYPRYLHNRIRDIKAFGAQGAVGRVAHVSAPSHTFKTIFGSPNEVNCYAFGKYLSQPLPWLGPGSFTDPREKPGRWGWDLDAFNEKIWMEWVALRYGRQGAPALIRALTRTDTIVPLVLDVGGLGFAHSYLQGPQWAPFLWEPVVDQVESLGMDFIRDEKRQAYSLTQQCLADVQSVKSSLAKTDYDQLIDLFEGELLIIRAFQAALEGYYQLYVAQKQPNKAELAEACHDMNTLATQISRIRGEEFFAALPNTLRALAALFQAGKAPTEGKKCLFCEFPNRTSTAAPTR
jgi:hypothetical protein